MFEVIEIEISKKYTRRYMFSLLTFIRPFETGDKNVERVLSWKFVTLDKNGDGYLDRAEYKELRRLAKKAVRPKKCARTFARTCDLNRDLKLSRQEWGACLANDFTRKFNTWCTCISHHKGKISRTFFGLLDHACTDQRFFFPSSNLNDCSNEPVYLDMFVTIYIFHVFDTIRYILFLLLCFKEIFIENGTVEPGIINSSCKYLLTPLSW